MIVRAVRHYACHEIHVYDVERRRLLTLPWNHTLGVRMGGLDSAEFDAEWKSGVLEIGERK